jgi:hypothetical protein
MRVVRDVLAIPKGCLSGHVRRERAAHTLTLSQARKSENYPLWKRSGQGG